jgi:hypothetical protein
MHKNGQITLTLCICQFSYCFEIEYSIFIWMHEVACLILKSLHNLTCIDVTKMTSDVNKIENLEFPTLLQI